MAKTFKESASGLALTLMAFCLLWPSMAWAGAQSSNERQAHGVWVLSRSIPKGGVLGPEDVVKKPLSSGIKPAGVVEDPSVLMGMRAVRSLQAGSVLRLDQFKPEPIVRKGQKVEILLEKGGLKIVAPGEALEEGGSGQKIRVLNISSRQVVLACVEHPGGVRVQF